MLPSSLQRQFSLLAFASLLCASIQASAQAGHLDPSFAKAGIFATSAGTTANAIAIQTDGKIVIAGAGNTTNNTADTLIRLTTNGTLDTSFGSGGVVNLFPPNVYLVFGLFAVAIQPDGKIVAGAGAATGQGNVVQIVRVEPNGSLDASFGNDGFTTAVVSPTGLPGSLTLQPNGEILVAAGIGNPSIMARFTSTGQLDTTFGNAGIATLANSGATQIAVQTNGKILVAAGETSRLVFEPQPAALPGAISRYNANGSLDTTFGSSGSTASVASPSALVLQSDGKIVVAGGITSRIHVAPAANDVGFGVVRFNSNGTLDASFGNGGVAIADFGANAPTSAAYAVAIQSNGDIVAAGAAGGKFVVNTATSSFGLARFTSTGILDTTFGAGGTAITTVGSSGQYSWLTGLAIQSDGKIVAVASSVSYYDYAYVARYLAH